MTTTDQEAADIAKEQRHVWWCLSEAGVHDVLDLVKQAANATGVLQTINLHQAKGWVIWAEIKPRHLRLVQPLEKTPPPSTENTPPPL